MANEALTKFPGPGQHEPDFNYFKNAAPKYGFGSEKLEKDKKNSKKPGPGPGNYQLPEMTGSGIKNTMAAKFAMNPEEKEGKMKPGPGNYDAELLKLKKTAAKFSIGSSPRFDRSKEKQTSFHVSPDKYNPNASSVLKGAS